MRRRRGPLGLGPGPAMNAGAALLADPRILRKETVATISLGAGEEHRVSWMTLKGDVPRLSLWRWRRDENGRLWPVRAGGVWLGPRELHAFTEGMQQVAQRWREWCRERRDVAAGQRQSSEDKDTALTSPPRP